MTIGHQHDPSAGTICRRCIAQRSPWIRRPVIEPNAAATNALQSPQEELVNTLTHGVGLLLSLAGLWVLTSQAVGSVRSAGCTIFGCSLVLLYLASTLYHWTSPGRRKHIFRLFDHMSIYVLIAGTYTMVALTLMEGVWVTLLVGAQWSLALGGILFKAICGLRFERLSVAIYILMGWMGIFALPTLLEQLPSAALGWLLLGGVLYTGGVAFYLCDKRIRFAHAAWHVFVMAGSGCHFALAFFYSTAATGTH